MKSCKFYQLGIQLNFHEREIDQKLQFFSSFLKMGESGYSSLDLKTSSQLLLPSQKYCPVRKNGNIKILEDNEFFQSLE